MFQFSDALMSAQKLESNALKNVNENKIQISLWCSKTETFVCSRESKLYMFNVQSMGRWCYNRLSYFIICLGNRKCGHCENLQKKKHVYNREKRAEDGPLGESWFKISARFSFMLIFKAFCLTLLFQNWITIICLASLILFFFFVCIKNPLISITSNYIHVIKY